MPAQLTGTKEFTRVLASLMARATTSLPEPLSPVISTVASDRAMRSISAPSSVMAWLCPMNCT
jgi:hypothetical protein